MLNKLAAVACLAMALAGCVSANQSETSPGSMNGFGRDPMSMITITSSSGAVSPDQAVVAAVAANLNKAQIDPQYSDPIETEGVSALQYGLGYGAAGATQGIKYGHAAAVAGAIVSGATGLVGGAINGEQIWSEAKVTGVGASTEQTLRDWERGRAIPPAIRAQIPNIRKLCEGLHAQTSIVRTHNRTPGNMPDWHGPRAGSAPNS